MVRQPLTLLVVDCVALPALFSAVSTAFRAPALPSFAAKKQTLRRLHSTSAILIHHNTCHFQIEFEFLAVFALEPDF